MIQFAAALLRVVRRKLAHANRIEQCAFLGGTVLIFAGLLLIANSLSLLFRNLRNQPINKNNKNHRNLFLINHDNRNWLPTEKSRQRNWSQTLKNRFKNRFVYVDDEYDTNSSPSWSSFGGNNCTLSSEFFNLLNESVIEKARSFVLDVTGSPSCDKVKLLNQTVFMSAEKWLVPTFEKYNYSAVKEFFSRCELEMNYTTTNSSIDFVNELASLNSSITSESSLSTVNRCELVKGRRVLINYAGRKCCRKSQYKNCLTGLTRGGFDACVSFNEKSLDAEFAAKNCRIFGRSRAGAGLWLWKPYIIYRTLLALDDGDFLFYADSGSEFVGNIDTSLICQQARLKQDVVVFSVGLKEEPYTKEEAFVLMACNSSECRNSHQRLASFVSFRRSHVSIRFAAEWLTYAQDWRILSNEDTNMFPNNKRMQFEKVNKRHRNDQSILSLLSKKWNLDVWPDPSNNGNKPDNEAMNTLKDLDRFKFMKGVEKCFFPHFASDFLAPELGLLEVCRRISACSDENVMPFTLGTGRVSIVIADNELS